MVLYLSGTGNTRWAAMKIAEATGEEAVNMADLDPNGTLRPLQPGERLGFCFPVHAWRPPRFVRRFVSRLTLPTDGHYVYALCTAGDTVGEAMKMMADDLRQRHITLNATYSILMPNTYVGLPFMDVDDQETECRKIADAEQLLRQHAQDIVQRKQGGAPLHIGRWPKINSRLLGAASVDYINSDKPFAADSARCVRCGICANVCPMHNIIGGLGLEPQWKHQDSCMNCFACYHHCPHHAIAYGRQTRHKGQYFFHHPQRRTSR